MSPDTMQVRLHLRLIRVVDVVVDTLSEIVVMVAASTRRHARVVGLRCLVLVLVVVSPEKLL